MVIIVFFNFQGHSKAKIEFDFSRFTDFSMKFAPRVHAGKIIELLSV